MEPLRCGKLISDLPKTVITFYLEKLLVKRKLLK